MKLKYFMEEKEEHAKKALLQKVVPIFITDQYLFSFYLAAAFPVAFGGVECFWKPCPSDKFRSHVASSDIHYYSWFFSTVLRLSVTYNLLT